jgi:hypothetical protein
MVVPSALLWDWMGTSTIILDTDFQGQDPRGMPTVNAPNSPYASGSTPVYAALLADPYGVGIPAAAVSVLTLTLVDTETGAIINGVDHIDILNVNRGALDSAGNLQIVLLAGDTSMSDVPGLNQVQRSMIIDWTYATSGPQASSGSGRHQVNFIVQSLAVVS